MWEPGRLLLSCHLLVGVGAHLLSELICFLGVMTGASVVVNLLATEVRLRSQDKVGVFSALHAELHFEVCVHLTQRIVLPAHGWCVFGQILRLGPQFGRLVCHLSLPLSFRCASPERIPLRCFVNNRELNFAWHTHRGAWTALIRLLVVCVAGSHTILHLALQMLAIGLLPEAD